MLIEILKLLAILCAFLGLFIVILLGISMIYSKIFNLSKIKNKKRFDFRIYVFLRKNHKPLGFIAIGLFILHALFFSTRIYLHGAKFFPYTGFLALVSFLLVAITGLYISLLKKDNTQSQARKLKRMKRIHVILIIIALAFAISHIIHR
jgi:hypothetical protein